jgi:predicted phosphoribosyltransferase
VDDGLDSSDRVLEGVIVARSQNAVRVIAAAPVGSGETCRRIAGLVDRCLCLALPTPFRSTAFWYEDAVRAAAGALFTGSGPGFARREKAFD